MYRLYTKPKLNLSHIGSYHGSIGEFGAESTAEQKYWSNVIV